jgi:REP element-mobilizing transposase RayT
MANTYSNLFYHFVFSTKGRVPFIHQDIENRIWSYIGGIARKHGMTALQVGGIETHIHATVMAHAKDVWIEKSIVNDAITI